ncbi:unnamed protein product [Urochloa humidicola]
MVLLRKTKRMKSLDSSAMPEGLLLPTSVRLSMLGLDFFPIWFLTRSFCYLLVISGVCVVGVSNLVVVVGRVVHDVRVLCGGFDTDEVLFDVFLCIGVRILCELHNTSSVHCVHNFSEFASNDMNARGRRFVFHHGAFDGDVFIGFWYLQGDFFVRFSFHLPLIGGRCSWIPFAGLLFLGRRLLEVCPASVSGKDGDCPGRSTIQQHIVLLMGLIFEVFSSIRKSAGSIFLELLHGGRWRRTRMQQRWSETAKSTGYCSYGLMCNFTFFQGYPVRGLDVKLLYQ